MMSFDGRQGSSAARPLTEPTTKTEAEKNKLDQSTRTAPANAAGREFTELKTPTSDKIQQMRAEELEKRQKAQQHWFRRGVVEVASFLWSNPVSKFARWAVSSAVGLVTNIAAWGIKQCTKAVFNVVVRPALNLLWNDWTSKLGKFVWKAVPSPLLDLAMHNAENLKENALWQGLARVAKGLYTVTWDNPISRFVFVKGTKAVATLGTIALFLSMEGSWPPTPMTAANHIDRPWAKKVAPVAFYGLLAVGTLAFGGAVATGMMGIGAALGYGFLVVPSAAAGANRIIAALGTQGESAQPGIGHYLEHKFSKAFWEMKKQQAAFDYVLVRDSETNEPVDFYLAPPSYETKNFLTKMLGYKYGSPQAVSGLVDFVLSEAHALQSIHGEESPLIIDDVLEMADRFYAVHELNPEAPSLFYPNGQLTVAGFNTVEAALQDFNPPGLRSIVKETYRARYVHKLVETIESQLRVDGFHGPLLTDEFVMELSGRLCEETADKLPSNPLVVRTLERKDFRPNPAEFLIVGGQILGGIASLPMTPVTILGHVLKAGSTVLFSEDKMKSFGLDDLQEVKMEIDRAIEEASSGDEVVAQMFRMSRLVVSKLEEGVTPFASELGLAVANSLIINAPYIAQQEMDALNIATDTHFVSPEELEALKQNPEMISEEERVQLVNEAERFLNQFGFELIQTDLPLAAKERKWFHYIPSMLLYPRRTTEVLLKTIGTIAGGDEKARRILKGLRCYFENKGLEYAQLNFERARSGLTRFEEFLELQTNNSEVKN